MRNYIYQLYLLTLIMVFISSCKKADFLDEKPSTSITQPTTLQDFELLLDNTQVMAYAGGLAQASADDHEVPYADYQAATTTERNAYVWNKEIYQGDVAVTDWNVLYQEIFYANVVLEGLAKSDSSETQRGRNIKGWALFSRAFAFYDLARTFCKPYDAGTADGDLGIPLRLASAIDVVQQRSTLQQTYDQIFADLNASIPLLQQARPAANPNRAWKGASIALLARIYLDMRNYPQAESFADQCLAMYDKLIDYNTVSQSSATPFSITNDELICNKVQVVAYARMTSTGTASSAKITPPLLSLYSSNDLRLKVYFDKGTDGNYTKKRGYNGSGLYPFTGLATDELYLIKSECLARRNETQLAMDKLNQMLVKRYDKSLPFVLLTASSPTDALNKILLERRKELIWRGLRWQDLRRLNKEGANITLSRTVNGVTFTLPPNDPRYVFPIPDDEIALSGITQNIR